MSGKPANVETILCEALEIPSAEQRAAYLDRQCAGNDALRREVEALIGAYHRAGAFLEGGGGAATLEGPATEDRSGTKIGPYKLLEPIGEGGMGTVYMAEQTHPVRRRVALKLIKPGMDTRQVIARFEAERQALAMMDHPNIARVLDAGTTDTGRPYFVMELVRGLPITEHCDREQLAIKERLELFVLVCRAVQHAHQKGIIHRDIKPTNVLITLHDGVPVPKVIDFGIAKATGQSLTEKTLFTGFTQLIGSPLYMSPEQAELSGLDIDTRSDIYSLGVLLYELLTGTTPFDGETLRRAAFDEMRRIIREEEPQKPSTRLSTLGATLTTVSMRRGADPQRLTRAMRGELDWIVMKALEKDRRQRYETASDFAADVLRYLADEPVDASPPGTWYRFGKSARRNRVALTTTALLALAIGIGLVTSLWFAVAAGTAERQARANLIVAEKRRIEAVVQENRAKSHLSRSLIRIGVQQLEEEPAPGFIELINAHAEAEHDPKLREAAARLWAVGIAPVEDRLAAVVGGLVLAFSPDGKSIATSTDGLVSLWETTTWGRRGKPMRHGSDSQIRGGVFSADGSMLATSNLGGEVRLWDVATCELRGILRAETSVSLADYLSMAFSPDGSLLAAWSRDERVGLWDTATGKPHGTPLQHGGAVIHVAFSPDGQLLATGGAENTARLWDVTTGEPIGPPLQCEELIEEMAFSPDGLLLATSALDLTSLWEVPSGRLHREPSRSAGSILAMAFSPDGKWLATGTRNRSVQIWEMATGQPLGKPIIHGARVTSVAFTPDSRLLATYAMNGMTQFWDIATQVPQGVPLPQSRALQSLHARLRISPDGRYFAVGEKTTTRVWRINQQPWTTVFEHADPVWALDVSPDGKRLATASGSAIRIWEVATGLHRLYQIKNIEIDTSEFFMIPSAVVFSPDGTLLAVIDSPRSVRLLDAGSGRTVGQSMVHPGRVSHLAFSPDGRRLMTSTDEAKVERPTIRLWETATQTILGETGFGGDTGPLCLATSPDGRHVAMGRRDWVARILEATSRLTFVRNDTLEEWGLSIGYSGDGRMLATGTMGGLVFLRDASTGQGMAPPVKLAGPVKELELSPDGKLLATATFHLLGDRHDPVRLWDLTAGSPYLSVALPQSDGTLCLALTPDGRWLAIGQLDGKARLLRMPTPPATTREMQIRTWTALGTWVENGETQQPLTSEQWRGFLTEAATSRRASGAAAR